MLSRPVTGLRSSQRRTSTASKALSRSADSRYVSGRAKTWLKVKSFTVGDYAVLGVERSSTGIPVALLATLGRNSAYEIGMMLLRRGQKPFA